MPAFGLLSRQSFILWFKPKFQTHAIWWVSQVLVQAEMISIVSVTNIKTKGNYNFIGGS